MRDVNRNLFIREKKHETGTLAASGFKMMRYVRIIAFFF